MDQSANEKPHAFATLLDQVRAEVKAGNTTAAIATSDRLIEGYSDYPQGYMWKARALANEQRLEEAVEVLRTGLSIHEDHPKLLNMARNYATQSGSLETAKQFADVLAELAPTDRRNRAFFVQYYSSSDDVDQALALAEELVSESPADALGWLLKCRVLLAHGRRNDALESVHAALREHPSNPKLLSLARYISSLHGRTGEAIAHAQRLSEVAPDDWGNRIFLATTKGDFAEVLRCAEELIAQTPRNSQGWIIKANALVALHQSSQARETLQDALRVIGPDQRIISTARDIAFAHGRFREATNRALELMTLAPADRRNERVQMRCWMATGEFAVIENYLIRQGARAEEHPLRKSRRDYREYKQLQKNAPVAPAAWRAALDNAGPVTAVAAPHRNATMIQYWSQGTPPDDVQLVISEWKALLEQERIGKVELFDRTLAGAWIDEHAPEFAAQFSNAFHYAMEADIFRVAYASKRPSIYVDADDWPLEHTAAILKFCIARQKSMLLFRSFKPWISNGFFISRPECPFFRELAFECLAIKLDEWQNDRVTIGNTFGPGRYNDVLIKLLQKSATVSASAIEGLPGCSRLALDGDEIYFSHEAAVAALKPPFVLGYKATDDYWKKLEG
jgi:tetratricopeptide (TPR) repeat protein